MFVAPVYNLMLYGWSLAVFNPPKYSDLDPIETAYTVPTYACIHVSDDHLLVTFHADDATPRGVDVVCHAETEDRLTIPARINLHPVTDEILVGVSTRERPSSDRVLFGLCGLLGRSYEELIESYDALHLEMTCSVLGEPVIHLGQHHMTPIEWVSLLLDQAKSLLETRLGFKVDRVLLTHSDSLGFAQRRALMEAAESSDLTVIRLLRHSVAASLGVGWSFSPTHGFPALRDLLDTGLRREIEPFCEHIMVTYTGSEATEVAVAKVTPDYVSIIHVESDVLCGVAEMDRALARHLLMRTGLDDSEIRALSPERWRWVLDSAVCARQALQTDTDVTVKLADFDDFTYALSSAEWRQIVQLNLARVEELWSRCLTKVGHEPTQFNAVLPLGATDLIPALHDACARVFGVRAGKGRALSQGSDLTILRGLSAQSGVLSGLISEILLLDATCSDLRIRVRLDENESEEIEDRVLVPANTTIPHLQTMQLKCNSDDQRVVALELAEWRNGVSRTIGRLRLDDLGRGHGADVRLECRLEIDAAHEAKLSLTELDTMRAVSVRLPWCGGSPPTIRELPGALNVEEISSKAVASKTTDLLTQEELDLLLEHLSALESE